MRRSYIWAFLFLFLIVSWLGSGFISDRGSGSDADSVSSVASLPSDTGEEVDYFRVRVRVFASEEYIAQFPVHGHTAASRHLDVRARTTGIVEESPHESGDRVMKGDLLCRLDMGDRAFRLSEAEASLVSARRDYEASQALVRNDFASAAKLADDRAQYDSALSSVDRIKRDIEYTSIRAPISGIISESPAEVGSFLQAGDKCMRLVVLDPLLIVGHVSERELPLLLPGMGARAELVTGEVLEGRIKMISPTSDPETRTFRIEMEARNTGTSGLVRGGITSRIIISSPARRAHFLPSSVLTLNDLGQIGVTLLGSDDRVFFQEVLILSHEADGIWVSGLPSRAPIITVGQDYVQEGERVDPAFDDAAGSVLSGDRL